MISINEQYEQILQPNEFIKNFGSLNEFRDWALQGSKLDLQEAIKVFQCYELYEHCAIMQNILNDLK